MRILYLIDSLGLGGAERHLLQIATHLAAEGVEQRIVTLFEAEALAPVFEARGIPVVRLRQPHRFLLIPRLYLALRGQAAAWRPDLVWTQLPFCDSLGRLAASSLGLPSLSLLQNTVYDPSNRRFGRLRARWVLGVLRWLERRSLGPRAAFVAVSERVRESYQRALGLDPDRIAVIPNTFDPSRFSPEPAARGPRSGPLKLLHAGRHVPQKGVDLLLAAMALAVRGVDARVIDAGCGDGVLGRRLRAAGFRHIAAFDLSDENAAAAGRWADRAFRAACESIPEPSGVYDAAVSHNVIEHTMVPVQALAELFRILKPGGWLHLTTDNAWWQTLMALRNRVTPPARRYRRAVQPIDGDFTTWEMAGLLSSAGFEVADLRGVGGFPAGDRHWARLLGTPTAAHPVLRHFTTRMRFLARKPL